ncbi:flavin-containing monooxygenase [Coprinopsis cinerea okayama7|uniref:Flavin-containing monooxygenase n=1 Tax=Coprinopsis cinerea (strain Okayama-7 / 130 / ATCC MYA-4618 / FGSC 9003) TaxID=240176 RepID=A8NA78_COPC7|nr:flavin-containing monooxygenase [Coprinopsis cinerea okayama7\|eukprot:XP_001831732.2 flavin-containing monooxygenase [Coprinopsis cinerea okayama7\
MSQAPSRLKGQRVGKPPVHEVTRHEILSSHKDTPSQLTMSMEFPDIPSGLFPTLRVLGTTLPPEFDASAIDAKEIAREWFLEFQHASSQPDPSALVNLFLPESTGVQVWWRDMLALTWDFRTFVGRDAIRNFALDRVVGAAARSEVKMEDLRLAETTSKDALGPVFKRPSPDMAWIQFFFRFKTVSGIGSGIVRVVPVGVSSVDGLSDAGNWKAHTIYTNLEGLIEHPEAVGSLRNQEPSHGHWESNRRKEVECEGAGVEGKPTVLIVGAGQCGLALAARLKMLGLKSLIIEQNERVGDNWRNRYEALCLHDTVWMDHMPYLPFPPNWQVYTPATKLANWLEHYAEIMELNVWLSSSTQRVAQDPETKKWDVTIVRKVRRADGTTTDVVRHFSAIPHLVMATGSGSGIPEIPLIDDVTMFQRSSTYVMSVANGWKAAEVKHKELYGEKSPPVDVADRISASLPLWAAIPLIQEKVRKIAELDKPLLDALHKVGFRTNLGYMDAGSALSHLGRLGGYYFGASRLIAEGKIKLKNDSLIKGFTKTGLRFEDGSELEADVVVFATGLGDINKRISRLIGEDLAKECTEIWGVDDEGEIRGAWRGTGIPRFWYMMGSLAPSRFHSKHLALQIKAIEEGLLVKRYTAKVSSTTSADCKIDLPPTS